MKNSNSKSYDDSMKDIPCSEKGLTQDRVFMIMAGGTGGHIFPGLAVAEELKKQGYSIHWLGTELGMEAQIIPKYNIPISFLSIKGVRGKGIKALLCAPLSIIKSTFQALKLMRKVKPKGVLGMGGFVAGPGSLAARLLGIPLVIHEQNSVAGITNRIAAPIAKNILVAFPNVFSQYKKTIFTGNPVRKSFKPYHKEPPRNKPLHLLVLGGSRGALAINQAIPHAMPYISSDFTIWHQTGEGHLEKTQTLYKQKNIEAKIVPFIDDMANALLWADLVICRSGALTVAELASTGKPSLLIPYPWHKDKQQLRNAEYLANNKAAFIINQQDCTPKKLAIIIEKMATDQQVLQKMAMAAYACAKPDATQVIAKLCEEVACE